MCASRDQSTLAHDRLEAAARPAPTDLAVADNREVAELPGGPRRARVQATAEDQTATDALTQHHVHEVVDSGSGAEAPLGERPERRVVPDVDREPGPLTQNAGDVDAAPVQSLRTLGRRARVKA